MASDIYERDTKSGRRYDVKWRDYGNPKLRTRTFHTREAAREHIRKVERAHDERRPYVDAPPPTPALTLAALATTYLIDRKRVARSSEALRQRETAISMFIGWIEGEEDETPSPRHLSRARLSDYHAWLLSPRAVTLTSSSGKERIAARQCSSGTANMRVRYVEAWWAWLADSDDYPEGAIPRPKRIDLVSPPAPPKPVAPTWAEMDAAIDCARPSWARLMTLLRCTGLRTGQAMRLRRDDVDLEAQTLCLRSELGKSNQERAGRTVPISPHLVAAIREWPVDPLGWLILWETPTQPTNRKASRVPARVTARRILARAGVRPEVWAPKERKDGVRRHAHPLHCFREGFISGLQNGDNPVDERWVKKLVGHSGGVTQDRYSDLDLTAAVAKVPPLTPRAGGRVLTLRIYTARRK